MSGLLLESQSSHGHRSYYVRICIRFVHAYIRARRQSAQVLNCNMPPQRLGRVRIRRARTHSSVTPPTQTDLSAQAPSLPSTPSPRRSREVTTEPATPASPTPHTRARTLRRERSINIPHSVLHYNRTENGLQPWYWYVFYSALSMTSDNLSFVWCHCCACRPVNEAGERVTPSKLLEHRHSHEFLGPCCLCASLESDGSSYTEASIFVAMSGPTAGEYTAACATGQCRYWGRFHIASSNNLGGPDELLPQFPSSVSTI